MECARPQWWSAPIFSCSPGSELYSLLQCQLHLHPPEAYCNLLPPIAFKLCVYCIINLWTKHALWLLYFRLMIASILPFGTPLPVFLTIFWKPNAPYCTLRKTHTHNTQRSRNCENITNQIKLQDILVVFQFPPQYTSPCKVTEVVKDITEIVCILYLYHPCHTAFSAWLDSLKMSHP